MDFVVRVHYDRIALSSIGMGGIFAWLRGAPRYAFSVDAFATFCCFLLSDASPLYISTPARCLSLLSPPRLSTTTKTWKP